MRPWVGWSYLLAAVGIFGLWLAGNKRQSGWLVNVGAQGLWITYAIVTEQFGFIFAALAYGFVYFVNWLKWRRADAEEPIRGRAAP